MSIKYVNVSTPAAFGVEWVNGDNGSTFQMVNIRGTGGLLFGVRLADSAKWITTPVIGPERFTDGEPIKTINQFMAVVRRYVEG